MGAVRNSSAALRPVAKQAAKKQKTMSIGVVLNTLNEQFPDVTVSKIRFLEAEGLISPQRTTSGYRRFTESDVDRLRYILATQRDNYTPLKVIKEQLDAMDSGQVTAIVSASATEPLVKPGQFRATHVTRLTDSDVATQAGITEVDVAELVKLGVVEPDGYGFFTADDVAIVTSATALKAFGFDGRALKSLRNVARRQADSIAHVVQPVALGRDADARQQAEELSQQIAALVVNLHATMVKTDLRTEFSS